MQKVLGVHTVNERVYATLEYNKIIEQLQEYATSSLGIEKAQQLTPSVVLADVEHALAATEEGANVLRLKGTVPLGGIHDVRAHAKRASIGGILAPTELLELADTIAGGRRLKQFILALIEDHELPIMAELAQRIEGLKSLEMEIVSTIDDHGEVLDGASPTLRRLRQEIRSIESGVRQKLDQLLRASSNQKMLQEAVVTIRNDRYVIPVKQEYRTHFGGLVHDQSASGATLFIEPQAVVQLNNKLRETKLKEEREIEKILRELTAAVALATDAILINVEALAELDFLFTKAKYAHAIRATKPILNERRYIKVKQARHPLIDRTVVVPIDVELGHEYTMLMITGPNTGGKTVTLKTIGLLTLMAQSGLFVPCREESELAVFAEVYADIGDEQSIEQSLSTFSSHLTNIIRILGEMDDNSLVLLDELGAGTDPTEGAALAMAILDHMHRIGARVVATTHYSELKAYAYNRANVINASVEFDVETLSPTYRLLIGVPGRSNAFAIAARLGLDPTLIERAKQHVDQESKQVENMIASLESNRKHAEEDRVLAEKYRREAERLRESLDQERARFEQEKKKLLHKVGEEARLAVQKAKEQSEEIIQELRQLALEEGASVKEHKLIEAKKRLEEMVPAWADSKRAPTQGKKGKQNIVAGDEVLVLSLGLKGIVLERAGDNEYVVQVGIMKSKIAAHDLQRIAQEKAKVERTIARVQSNRETIRTELDLRGTNVDEAILAIDKYIDEALLAGLHQVRFIHGLGTGALRRGVQEYLRQHRAVQTMRHGVHGEGGTGVTVVELK